MDIDYESYRLSGKEVLTYTAVYLICLLFISYLFYDSMLAATILIIFYPIYMKEQKRRLSERQRNEVKLQFCEMISSLSTALNAGFSVDNAFRECISEMIKMFGDKSCIVVELGEIIRKLDVGIPLYVSLNDFSKRAHVEDISDFMTVFIEATKSGGNLIEIIKSTVDIMQEKRRIEEEIEAMLKGKMLEQKVISIIPFLIFIYLRFSSGEFMSVLYHNVLGICVMTVCLIVYVSSLIMADRIVNIKV